MSARIAISAALLLTALAPSSAQAAFGLNNFDVTITGADGSPATQAGSHPFAITTSFGVNYTETGTKAVPEGDSKDLLIEQMKGFVGDATAIPRCSNADFSANTPGTGQTLCPDSTAVGLVAAGVFNQTNFIAVPVFNLEPPPGVQARLGFSVVRVRVVVDVGVKQTPPYNILAAARNNPQILPVYGAKVELWGNPTDPAHDHYRGSICSPGFDQFAPSPAQFEFKASSETCPTSASDLPFLTLPRSCEGPGVTSFETNSWQEPEKWITGSAITHDDSVPPSPQGLTGCGKLGFSPKIASQPTADSAETGTGLDFNIDFEDEGLKNPEGIAQSEMKEITVTLPEGVTINPSIGEGLGVCTPADYDRESLAVAPGQGCPNASKIGTVSVDTPLLASRIDGSVYLAQQDDPGTTAPGAENPFDSLIAFYIVLRSDQEQIMVKVPAKVEPDPLTGQLVTTVKDVPQFPFSHFNFHFKEGQRAPLITPPACGVYETKAELTPRARPEEVLDLSASFKVSRGIGGGPCPPGGVPSFNPGFEAGSINNEAKAFSPFYMRLTRSDGEQDMTKFSSVLPPGVLGKLAGVSKCPDSAIDVARAKTGRQELANPSCPANSQIGRTLAGAGVGSALTYVGGQIYLGGPYKGKPLSVISVTPAVAGPFDAGTVVVRLALDLDPETAEVEVDGAASDPIPHILKGIVLKVRDLRVYVDRPEFTLNPTSCDPSSARAQLFGGFLDVHSPLDDVPVALSSRYQAANCQNLAFKPKLNLNLRGGTKRGDHPGLKAVLKARPGDANIAAVTVTLPRSAFLDQAHIRTICTRVQFAANQCPAGSIYGQAKAITPLLDEPIEGPVILRSSNNKLPDLVIALKGLVDVNVSSRIDSKNGGIRNSFEVIPDAPVTEFLLTLQGGNRGLIVNSRDLCKGKARVKARFLAQNGKAITLKPELKPQCGGKG